jgi:protocatechuate 3,4-dioxygenase beta subunit
MDHVAAVNGRRRALAVLGATAAALVVPAHAADSPGACVVRPEQTEGPYFVDEELNRSDIRTDPADGVACEGAPLRITFRVSRLEGGGCVPLSGATIEVWQCDAHGVYSDVRDAGFDTRGKKFLRGFQQTDPGGNAEFVTIYPGWYAGRTPHVHFMVRTRPEARGGHSFTSQLYFDDALSDVVLARAPYAARGKRTTRNAGDGIFRRGGSELLLPVRGDGQGGYAGTFELALRA